jgi:hypothetical protein
MFAACGGDGDGGSTPAQAVTANINQTCSIAFECKDSFPPDLGFEFADLFGANEAECQATFTEIIDPNAVQASVDAGRIIFDSADNDACFAATDAASCDEFWNGDAPAACDTSFVGTVADGGACTISDDCAGADSGCDEATLVCGP